MWLTGLFHNISFFYSSKQAGVVKTKEKQSFINKTRFVKEMDVWQQHFPKINAKFQNLSQHPLLFHAKTPLFLLLIEPPRLKVVLFSYNWLLVRQKLFNQIDMRGIRGAKTCKLYGFHLNYAAHLYFDEI